MKGNTDKLRSIVLVGWIEIKDVNYWWIME